MTAAWMTTTLDAPSEGGGYSLLPAGINNYTIKNAEIVANKWNGRNEVVLTISCPEGSGKTDIPLEPWSADAVDTFLKVFKNGLGNIGIPVEGKTPQQILATLTTDLPKVIGNVVEFSVEHKTRKAKPDGSHLKQDGTPWMDAKAYINRLVQRGTGLAPSGQTAAAPTDPGMSALDAAFAAVPAGQQNADDLPF